MKTIILCASVAVASGVLFVNLYTSMVDVKSWGNSIPGSVSVAREYFKVVSPGNFFRIFSPANQLLSLVALIIFWKSSLSIRYGLAAAFVAYVIADVLTFAYFYPRNAVLFSSSQLPDADILTTTIRQWRNMNWIRSLIILSGLIFSFVALIKITGHIKE